MHTRFMLLLTLTLVAPALLAAPRTEPGNADLVTTFVVASPTKVPGKTLRPGTYSIRVVDHLSDRVILEVAGEKGKAETKFLGVENAAIRGGTGTGPIPYGVSHGDPALRGFAFPGGSTAEFVYPKEEAVVIAKASTSRVPAIDPASEGRVSTRHLSKEDMQMVTLWMLSSTRVGPENASQAAIQAERYQQPAVAATALPQQTRMTAGTTPASQVSVKNASSTALVARQRIPRLRSHTVLTSLPHTASSLPLAMLTGMLLLFAAGITRLVRVAVREQ